MTCAPSIANFTEKGSQAMASRPLRAFRTAKANAIASSGCGASKPAQDREEMLRKHALEEMFVASREKFLSAAYSIVRNREDAEDAVQEAFLLAYRHLHRFEGRSALKTWLTRIVWNAALMTQRKRKPIAARSVSETGGIPDDDWTESIPDVQPDPEMVHAERETLQFIDGILGKMKPVLRQAFRMTYYEELSGREACAMLGVSFAAFKARLFRARRQLLLQTDRAVVSPMRGYPIGRANPQKRKGLMAIART